MSTAVQPSSGHPPTQPSIADLEACDPETFVRRMGVLAEWQAIKDLTTELFPGPMELEVVRDPELSGDVYLWIRVLSTATVEEALAREMNWINRSIDAAGEQAGLFRVSVDAVR
ncbi:MAG TPA: hypothetical protein VND64_25780 [Pirellulales bacterium]|nr:hypothetical protein [Pirellulales bacterium]